MGAVNIRQDVSDQFYRYKMPALLTKIEGRGNGIRTVVPNMHEIGKSLNRPPSYLTKFFGCELGSHATCDEKNNKYLVNGSHDASRLQELLYVFINKFVLCGHCTNPETDLFVSKDSVIMTDCKACGEKIPVDQSHKLTTFILKTAPTKKLPQKKQVSKDVSIEPIRKETPEDEEWGEDMSEEAVSRRRREMLETLPEILRSKMSVSDSPEDLQLLTDHIMEHRPNIGLEFLEKARTLGIKDHKTLFLLFQFGFTDNILDEMPKCEIFQSVELDSKAQKAILGGIEKLLIDQYPQTQKELPMILHYLYTNDILEEDTILDWAVHPSKRYVTREQSRHLRALASEFVEWLKGSSNSE